MSVGNSSSLFYTTRGPKTLEEMPVSQNNSGDLAAKPPVYALRNRTTWNYNADPKKEPPSRIPVPKVSDNAKIFVLRSRGSTDVSRLLKNDQPTPTTVPRPPQAPRCPSGRSQANRQRNFGVLSKLMDLEGQPDKDLEKHTPIYYVRPTARYADDDGRRNAQRNQGVAAQVISGTEPVTKPATRCPTEEATQNRLKGQGNIGNLLNPTMPPTASKPPLPRNHSLRQKHEGNSISELMTCSYPSPTTENSIIRHVMRTRSAALNQQGARSQMSDILWNYGKDAGDKPLRRTNPESESIRMKYQNQIDLPGNPEAFKFKMTPPPRRLNSAGLSVAQKYDHSTEALLCYDETPQLNQTPYRPMKAVHFVDYNNVGLRPNGEGAPWITNGEQYQYQQIDLSRQAFTPKPPRRTANYDTNDHQNFSGKKLYRPASVDNVKALLRQQFVNDQMHQRMQSSTNGLPGPSCNTHQVGYNKRNATTFIIGWG